MSDTETHFGKLEKVGFKIKTIPFKNKVLILETLGFEIEDYEEDGSYFESSDLHYCKELDEFYKFKEHDRIYDNNFVTMSENKDGSLTFGCSFYNGGAGFSEVLDDMLVKQAKIESKKKGYNYEQ